jgi:hypothetical protein
VATETDAARDRVIAARADLGAELETLEAAARAAVDIKAKVRRSPAKAAAVVGGAAFVALKGPQRLVRGARRVVRGPSKALPDSMLPDEIEKSLRALGTDGDKVRGAIERDFADYAKKAARDRRGTRNLLFLTVARPLLARGARLAGEWLVSADETSFSDRLTEIRGRAGRQLDERDRARSGRGKGSDEEPPTGV